MSKKHNPRRTILKRIMIVIGLILLILVVFLVARLLQLRSSVGQFREYWQVQADTIAPEGALIYVALGDSAAQGIGASKPMKGYVGLVASALSQKHHRPVHVINLSVNGAKIQDVLDDQLSRLDKYKVSNDTVVTVDIGANNMRHFDSETFKRQYEDLLTKLPKQTVVADIPYFGPDYHGHGGKEAKKANEILVPLIEKYGFRRAPLYKETKENERWTNYAADFFHPSDKGYQNWFNAYWQVLK